MTASAAAPTEPADQHGCRQCGWPVDQPSATVSSHRTSEGVIVYTRCVCGTLNVWLETTARRLVTP
ncbi:hypothetical protein ACQPW1_36590 [Nocardia sp. CA-128927]|uniref:hypothetical protein n=1 Tax=Nocardia sp. CA-128927 TaxID=3239975 RepID=UPI003D957F75